MERQVEGAAIEELVHEVLHALAQHLFPSDCGREPEGLSLSVHIEHTFLHSRRFHVNGYAFGRYDVRQLPRLGRAPSGRFSP